MSWRNIVDRLLGRHKKSPQGAQKSVAKDVNLEIVAPVKQGSDRKTEKKLSPEATQLPGSHPGLQKQQLFIGLDFGTAFTKVVIGESRVRYVVPFAADAKKNVTCLPCEYFVTENGHSSLARVRSSDEKVTNLKMPLIEGRSNDEQRAKIIVFLALALQQIRNWLLTSQAKVYQGKNINWHINIGLPTEKFDEDHEMVTIYRQIVQSAWYLSAGDESITQTRALDALEKVSLGMNSNSLKFQEGERWIHPENINCFPEFVAMVSGYVRSPRRQDDLHLLVDIGAGTADVTVFNVHKNEEEDVFPIFAKGVRPLGAAYLLLHRFEQLGKKTLVDATMPVPDDASFCKTYGIAEKDLNEVDQSFQKEFHRLVAEQLKRVKIHRYPNSRRWKNGIPCFISGGGKDIELYVRVLKKMQKPDFPYRISLDSLFCPRDLQGARIQDEEFSRILVAYGLSVDPFDIGKIIKSQDVPDDDPPPRRSTYEDSFPGKEVT